MLNTFFLSKEYIAIALIKAKQKFFNEGFITFLELSQFSSFLQQEFNNRDLNVVITSNNLDIENFNIVNEVIIPSRMCCFNLYLLPINISTILIDENLLLNFFTNFNNEKLKTLENTQTEIPKLYKKQK